MLARYSTLRTTLDGLMEHEQQNQDAIDEEKADLVKFMEVRKWALSAMGVCTVNL